MNQYKGKCRLNIKKSFLAAKPIIRGEQAPEGSGESPIASDL